MNSTVRMLEIGSMVCLSLALAGSLFTVSLGVAWSSAVMTAFVALALSTWLLSVAARGALSLPRPWLVIAAVAFAILVGLSAVAGQHAVGWRSAVSTMTPVLGFLVAGGLLSSRRLRLGLWRLLAIVVLVLGTYGVMQSLGLQLTSRSSGAQRIWISSFFYHYSHYSGYLALAAPAALTFALFARTLRARVICSLISLVLLLNLVLTWSWDVIVVTFFLSVALLGLWALRHQPGRLRRAGVVAVGIVCVAAVSSYTFVRGADYRPNYLTTAEDVVGHLRNRLGGRFELYQVVVRLPAERPLLGSGPGTFAATFPSVRTEDEASRPFLLREVNYAHNDLLQVASESGLPATVAFAAFWLLVVVRPSPRTDFTERTALRAAIVCLLLCGLLDANLTAVPPTALLAWVAAGMLHAPNRSGSPLVDQRAPTFETIPKS